MKRIIPLVLALLLVFTLFGCTTNAPVTSVQPSSAPDVSAAPAASDAPSEVSKEVKLPIVSETKSFSIWSANSTSSAGIESYNDNFAWQELEKKTNIHIDWTNASDGMANEQFNLSIQSGDYFDSYWGGNFTGSFDYYIDTGVILDLADLIKQYAPNYDALRRLDEQSFLQTVTDSGRAPGFYEVSQSKQWSFVGPIIRKDFLDTVGLEVPKTYDQLHTVLKAFKDQLNLEIPLSIESAGIEDWLISGKDTTYFLSYFNEQFYQVDGKVEFGPTTDKFKEYLAMVKQWYGEGLIDKEFYSRQGWTLPSGDQAFMCKDKVGAGKSMYTFISFLKQFAENEKFELVAMPAPVENEGDKLNIMFGGGSLTFIKGSANVITTACEDPETFMKWYDYLYTEEGSLLLNYGIEGVSFNYADDGKPAVTEMIYADKNNRGVNGMLAIYSGSGSGGPWYYDWRREIRVPGTTQAVLDSEQIWNGNMSDELYSYLSLQVTQDETSRFNSIMNDVDTYIKENVVKFIIGQIDMDKEWDTFQKTLKNLGIDEAIQMQQSAYDRYQGRSAK